MIFIIGLIIGLIVGFFIGLLTMDYVYACKIQNIEIGSKESLLNYLGYYKKFMNRFFKR